MIQIPDSQTILKVLLDEELRARTKQPLWTLERAVLYAFGVDNTSHMSDVNLVSRQCELASLFAEAMDANRIFELSLIHGGNDYDPFNDTDYNKFKVKPMEWIRWLKKREHEQTRLDKINLTLPRAVVDVAPKPDLMPKAAQYTTPELTLLNDAAQYFWGNFDPADSNNTNRPMKEQVAGWIMDEAKKRGFEVKDYLAKAMDSIIRDPICRDGGVARVKKTAASNS